MPEGDTIYKVAHFIAPLIVNREIRAARLLGAPAPLIARRRILEVKSWGKHLLFYCTPEGANGLVLRVHLGMHGSWHSYPAHIPAKSPIGAQDLELVRSDGHRFVCFRPEDVEILRAGEIFCSDILGKLGPCLLAETFDHASLHNRLQRVPPSMPLIDVLLSQNIAAGLGNVYKSELLFLHGLHPLTPKRALSLQRLKQLFADGRTLLQRNLGGWPRTITYDRSTRQQDDSAMSRYFVYGRSNEPCLRCQTAIVRSVLGRHSRSCYHCPSCQSDGLDHKPSEPLLLPHVASLP